MRPILLVAPFIAGAALSGCAHTGEVPTQALSRGTASVRAAEEAGAQNEPQAALHLKLAREQAELANKLAEHGDFERAAMVASRAEADGQLAMAIAHQAKAKAEAKAAVDQAGTLQNKEAQQNQTQQR